MSGIGDESYQGHNLVFLVGCPRSGTTYLQRLLASHPRIKTGQESDLFDLYAGPLLRAWRDEFTNRDGRGGVGMSCYLTEEEFLTSTKRYLCSLLQPMVGSLGPGEIFLEKTPSHALFIQEILCLLPESRFIHLVRDARDTVASLLAAAKSWGKDWAPGHVRRAARMWTDHVEAVLKAREAIPAEQFIEVKYEALRHNPHNVLQQLTSFLQLGWSEDAIQRALEANRLERVQQGAGTPIPRAGERALRGGGHLAIDPPGFARRGISGGWQHDLSWLETMVVWVMTRHTMRKVGYPWRAAPASVIRNEHQRDPLHV